MLKFDENFWIFDKAIRNEQEEDDEKAIEANGSDDVNVVLKKARTQEHLNDAPTSEQGLVAKFSKMPNIEVSSTVKSFVKKGTETAISGFVSGSKAVGSGVGSGIVSVSKFVGNKVKEAVIGSDGKSHLEKLREDQEKLKTKIVQKMETDAPTSTETAQQMIKQKKENVETNDDEKEEARDNMEADAEAQETLVKWWEQVKDDDVDPKTLNKYLKEQGWNDQKIRHNVVDNVKITDKGLEFHNELIADYDPSENEDEDEDDDLNKAKFPTFSTNTNINNDETDSHKFDPNLIQEIYNLHLMFSRSNEQMIKKYNTKQRWLNRLQKFPNVRVDTTDTGVAIYDNGNFFNIDEQFTSEQHLDLFMNKADIDSRKQLKNRPSKSIMKERMREFHKKHKISKEDQKKMEEWWEKTKSKFESGKMVESEKKKAQQPLKRV